jgi:hypothetical protein
MQTALMKNISATDRYYCAQLKIAHLLAAQEKGSSLNFMQILCPNM